MKPAESFAVLSSQKRPDLFLHSYVKSTQKGAVHAWNQATLTTGGGHSEKTRSDC